MEKNTHIKITVKKNFRKFKEGQVYEFDIKHHGITYLTGKNGQGKTTILRAFRLIKDSLKEVNRRIADGLVPSELKNDENVISSGFEIEGFDYDEVFSLDSVIDDPLTFQNAASAASLINGGGLQMMNLSKGERAIFLLHKFIKKVSDFLEKYTEEELLSKKILIMMDEIDEGFDAKIQMNFNIILFLKLIASFNADILLVTHNTLCMLSPSFTEPLIYDIETLEETTPHKYFENKTGYKIELKKIEENEQENLENCKQITES